MKRMLLSSMVCAAFIAAAFAADAQNPQPQPPPRPAPAPAADPYANNPNAGATKFPLAAPAGRDSGARQAPPAGAVNQGAFDPASWKYGAAFNAPSGSRVWNPAN